MNRTFTGVGGVGCAGFIPRARAARWIEGVANRRAAEFIAACGQVVGHSAWTRARIATTDRGVEAVRASVGDAEHVPLGVAAGHVNGADRFAALGVQARWTAVWIEATPRVDLSATSAVERGLFGAVDVPTHVAAGWICKAHFGAARCL